MVTILFILNKKIIFMVWHYLDITNAEFLCGKAEDVLPNLLKRYETEKVIAIVDPPRAGLRMFFFLVKLKLFLKYFN